MFENYKALVVFTYKKKRDAGELPASLARPTRATIKSECEKVFSAGYLKKDEKVISDFFGRQENETEYLRAIRRSDRDDFAALYRFLSGSSKDTNEGNIELLAWLIGFEPRPYQYGQDYILPTEAGRAPASGTTTEAAGGPQLTPVVQIVGISQEPRTVTLKWPAIFVVLLITFCSAGYYISRAKKSLPAINPVLTGTEKCMIWADDHYQPVSCNLKIDGQQVVALDTIQLKGFKKIMRNDTVTRYSINKLWYFKAGGQLELFTAPGFHPVHTDRKLRRLSEHMLFTYVHKD